MPLLTIDGRRSHRNLASTSKSNRYGVLAPKGTHVNILDRKAAPGKHRGYRHAKNGSRLTSSRTIESSETARLHQFINVRNRLHTVIVIRLALGLPCDFAKFMYKRINEHLSQHADPQTLEKLRKADDAREGSMTGRVNKGQIAGDMIDIVGTIGEGSAVIEWLELYGVKKITLN